MTSKTDIAHALLSIKAVFLRPNEPFTWASGIKSPIYCDNRLTLSYPDVRSLVDGAIAELVQEHYPQVQTLMGTATAGIAHAAIAADKLNLPMGYVRGSAKDHGRKNRIEGKLEAGDRVVVVEDLVSTGGSVIECVEALREAEADVLGMVSIFTYGMQRAKEHFAAEGLKYHSLCDLDTLAEVAVKEGYIKSTDRARLLAFRDNPSNESWMSCEA